MPARRAAVQALFWINVLSLVGGGALFLALPELAVPGANELARPSLRAFGVLQLCFGLLVASLGAVHHGAYCVLFTFHFLTSGAVGAEAYGGLVGSGATHERLRGIALGHLLVGSLMFAILVTGGIGAHGERTKVKA